MANESEYQTRKKRIDTRLKKLGWEIVPFNPLSDRSTLSFHAVEEFPTESGPADYALFVNGDLIGFIEAKKVTVATLNALEQAKRYSKTVDQGSGNWNGCKAPFLFSSNGELVYFLDVREQNNISRRIADFYSPQGLSDLFHRKQQDLLTWTSVNSIDNPRLRPYQKEAIANGNQLYYQSHALHWL